MKQLSNRGVARIGAVWMIVVIVLFFVAVAFGYVANQEAQKAKEARDAMSSDLTAANIARDLAVKDFRELSVVVGYRDRAATGSTSDIALAKAGVGTLVTGMGLDPSVVAFQDAIEPSIEKLRDANNLAASRQKTIDGHGDAEEKRTDAAKQALATLTTVKEKEIVILKDSESSLKAEVATLKSDLGDRTAERNSLSTQLNQAKAENDALVVQLAEERQIATDRMTNLSNAVEDFTQRAETSDAEILATSKELGTAWINRGTIHKVTEGMRFEVMTGHPNPKGSALKAMAEVLRVTEKTSEVRIYDVKDQYDPVVTGDQCFNPIYDPEGTRNAVLAGRFGGTYNEAEIALLLAEIGITVQKELDLTTNYLIVGQPMYTDENGDPLEEPRQPSELGVYKNAQAQGCSIVSITQFQRFFKR